MQTMWNVLCFLAYQWAEREGDWEKVTFTCRAIFQSCFTNLREDTTKHSTGQHTVPFAFMTATVMGVVISLSERKDVLIKYLPWIYLQDL